MTALIEKLAFMPPHPENAQKVLPGKVGFIQSKLGHKISYMDLIPRSPERCITASGERTVPGPCQAWEGGLFSPRYTMLYAHMNGEDLSFAVQPLAMMAERLGIRIIAYDYPGYGLSEEISSSEENAIAAEEAMFLYLTQMVGIPRERLIIAGRSVGGGPSTWLASRQPGLAALILICTFKSIAQVAGSVAGVIGKAIDIFPNIKRIAKVKDTPVLIVHGENDRLVNHEHGKALYKVALQNNLAGAQMITIPGAGHNNLDMKNPGMFYGGIRTFIEGCARRIGQQAITYGNATVPRAPRPATVGQGMDLPESWTTHAPSCTCPPPKPRGQHQQQHAQQQGGTAPLHHQYQQQQQQLGAHQMPPQDVQQQMLQFAQQQQQQMHTQQQQNMMPMPQYQQQQQQVGGSVPVRRTTTVKSHGSSADAAAFALQRAVLASGLGVMPQGQAGSVPVSMAERKRQQQQQFAAAATCTPAGSPIQPQQMFVDPTFGMQR